MIKDVEYEYKIVRTAELLVNLGDDFKYPEGVKIKRWMWIPED